MDDLFLIGSDGTVKYGYKRDGTPSSIVPQQIWAASALKFQSLCQEYHCITSRSGKMIFFFPTEDKNDLYIYITTVDRHPRTVAAYIRAQMVMANSFIGNFVHPLHIDGINVSTQIGLPCALMFKETRETRAMIERLQASLSTRTLAIYVGKKVAVASDEFWLMNEKALQAIDLFVNHTEAPISDQLFMNAGWKGRAISFLLFDSLKLVVIAGGNFDVVNAVSNLIPSTLYPFKNVLQQFTQIEPVKQTNVHAWAVVDLVTPRWFGDVPPEYENVFIEMMAKSVEISEDNRVRDILMRLPEHMFTYVPRYLSHGKRGLVSSQTHFWTYYSIHDYKDDVHAIRKTVKSFLASLGTMIRPIAKPIITQK